MATGGPFHCGPFPVASGAARHFVRSDWARAQNETNAGRLPAAQHHSETPPPVRPRARAPWKTPSYCLGPLPVSLSHPSCLSRDSSSPQCMPLIAFADCTVPPHEIAAVQGHPIRRRRRAAMPACLPDHDLCLSRREEAACADAGGTRLASTSLLCCTEVKGTVHRTREARTFVSSTHARLDGRLQRPQSRA